MIKWEYRVQGVVGNYSVLADETAGDVSEKYEVSFKDKAEVAAGFGAGSVGIAPNANTVGALSIPLTRVLPTPGAAQADMRLWRTRLKGLRLILKSTAIPGAAGGDVEYYPSAVLVDMTAKLNGQAVDYVFTFSTQDVTSVEPN